MSEKGSIMGNTTVYCVSVGFDYGIEEPTVYEFGTLEEARNFFGKNISKFDETDYAILEEVEYTKDGCFVGSYEIDYKEY